MSEPSQEKPARILIADDEPLNRDLMKLVVNALGHDAVLAASGAEALAAAGENPPDLVILDVMMPGMDGYEVARRLKASERTRGAPIVMVSALDDADSKLAGLAAGAEDFLSRPVNRVELRVRVQNLLKLKRIQDSLAAQADLLEHRVRARTEELDRTNRETIRTLTRVAGHRDDETGAHVRRIGFYTERLAERIGMEADFRALIAFASPLHDVGKVAMPDRVLAKPGALSADEWLLMRTHAELGARMLAQNSSPYLAMATDIARAHHERWDGSGYPQALAGESIPLAARITALADTYDVLRSMRPYKAGVDHATAASALLVGDARSQPAHFDPAVLAAFKSSLDVFRDIFETVRDSG